MGSFITSNEEEHVTNTTTINIKQPSKQQNHQNILSVERNAFLFMSAFTKEFSDHLFIPISIEIVNLIMLFSKYEINVYGIGQNHNQFFSENRDSLLNYITSVNEFTELHQFQKIFKLWKCNIDHIYHCDKYITILHTDKQRLYYCGTKKYNIIKSPFSELTEFTELLNSNEHIQFLSHGIHQNCGFCVTDTQRILVSTNCRFGSNAPIPTRHLLGLTTFFKELKIMKIVENEFNAFFLCENGKVYYVGDRMCAENTAITVPEIIPNLESKTIANVVSGYHFALFLTVSGNVFGIGNIRFLGINWNKIDGKSKKTKKIPYSGRIGHHLLKYVFRATKLNMRDITQIECGYLHSLVLNNSGYCYCFGNNYCGQLGIGPTETENTEGQTYELKLNNMKIKSVFCGNKHSLVLNENNELFSFGCNDHNESYPQINDEKIYTPRWISKQIIGTNEISNIIDVLAGLCWTILVVST
eukprot:463036_1